jgi:hypothetical protein
MSIRTIGIERKKHTEKAQTETIVLASWAVLSHCQKDCTYYLTSINLIRSLHRFVDSLTDVVQKVVVRLRLVYFLWASCQSEKERAI